MRFMQNMGYMQASQHQNMDSSFKGSANLYPCIVLNRKNVLFYVFCLFCRNIQRRVTQSLMLT